MVSKVLSSAIYGVEGYIVDVEVDIHRGMPAFDIVGLPSSAVKEARERVTTALTNMFKDFSIRRVMVNLAPANTKKEGASFDLPIAAAILICLGVISKDKLDNTLVLGELSLDGGVRPVTGVLPMVYTAKRNGIKKCIVPFENREEAALVKGMEVIAVLSLEALINHCTKEPLAPVTVDTNKFFSGEVNSLGIDFADVKGQRAVKRALEVCAAGNHNLLMIGPPGSGKTMLAKRLPTILPDLTIEESLAVTMVYSVAGMLENTSCLITNRPFRTPHHTISYAGLTGGGHVLKPGEISLSHKGILYLDELTEFNRNVIEVLRQPMEDGKITITRASGTVTYPSDFMLLVSMNPCPCGYYGVSDKCTCSANEVSKYLSKVSGPLLDRIDIQVEAPAVNFDELGEIKQGAEASMSIKERVLACRGLQKKRYESDNILVNSQLLPAQIERYCSLGADEKEMLKMAFDTMGLSVRAYHKILKVARTIADMEESQSITVMHLAEAISYRSLDRKYWG